MDKLPEIITAKIDGVVINDVVDFKIYKSPRHSLLSKSTERIAPNNEVRIYFTDGSYRDFLNDEIQITIEEGV